MNRLLAIAAISLASFALLSACGERTSSDGADVSSATPVPASDPGASDTTLPGTTGDATMMEDAAASTTSTNGGTSERTALGVLSSINAHEIAAGEQALRKGVKGEVAAYAKMMIDQHTENQAKTLALDPDASASDAMAQQRKGEAELAALDAKSGDDYARAYVDAMVKGHTEALEALDNRLIPAATSEPARQHFTTTRGHVAAHLEQAQRLAEKAPAD